MSPDPFLNSKVKPLTSSDFNGMNIATKECSMVLFHSPFCGHCIKMHDEWKKFAETNLLMNVYHLDASVYGDVLKNFTGKFAINGYPTILFYYNSKPIEFYEGGERKMANFNKFAIQKCKLSK